MNETKKLIITGAIVIVLIALIPITALVTNARSKKIVDEFYKYIDSKEEKIVYIGRDDCMYCQYFKPEIEFINDEYGVEYLYINTNKLKDEHLGEILDKLEVDGNNFGTPHLSIVKDGEKIAENPGYLTENKLFDFLQENNMIDEEEKLPLNYIDYEQYEKLISSKDNQLIVLSTVGSADSIKVRPILYEIAREYNVKINYLNTDLISDSESRENFKSSLEHEDFAKYVSIENAKELGQQIMNTSLVMVVSNKEVKDSIDGVFDKETLTEFLKENKFIK